MKKTLFLICPLALSMAVNGQIRVGFLTKSSSAGIEQKHCMSALSPYPDITIVSVPLEDILNSASALKDIDVLWIQRTDTGLFTSEETNPKVIRNIRAYTDGGGRLLLNQESFRYVNLLALEVKNPETRNKSCFDEGYGRKLGFHAFREHPLFAGLNGGAYIQRPVADTTVRITGYFGNDLPLNGKVIAVDWDYIFLREDSKLVIEYMPGRGKVIAVGGYMSFSTENQNSEHLARFTANAIRYLAGKNEGDPEFYWYYGPYSVSDCPPKLQNTDRLFAAIPDSKAWEVREEQVRFGNRTATGNFWDVAGERLVIMGKENGGIGEIWTHPFMALRDYDAGIVGKDSVKWLSSLVPQITISPSYIQRIYTLSDGVLTELVAASPNDPSGVVHYEYNGKEEIRLVIRFRSNLRFMWPYSELATGTICHAWDADYNAFTVLDRTGFLAVAAGGNKAPVEHSSRQDGKELMITTSATYNLGKEDFLDFVIAGTSEGAAAALNAFDRGIRDPEGILSSAMQHTAGIFEKSLVITSPNDTFNQGYMWAMSGTDKFFVYTPGMGSSLVAGYSTTKTGWDGGHKVDGRPGYGWYFGRDGQWSGLALLDYGDFEKVKEILAFYERYQDLSGKIFHEATTSGVIHYDAADATPLYVLLAGRFYRYSNDTVWLRNNWPYIRKAIDFCFGTDTDKDHLIENTNVGHGWVEGGELYGSHATLYLNACWAAALEEAWNMAGFIKESDRDRFMAEHNAIMNIINRDFWQSSPALGGPGRDNGFYSYGKNRDGSYRKEITVLPAVPIYLGLTESAKAKNMLDRFAGNTFSTNWGVRIIGDDSPLFKPTGYHYGSVWPLFTGWTALAEYKAGNYNSGFTHIMNNLNVYRNWALGYVEEVLNGAFYKPSGVCPHQCWSETMVLQPAIEGLLGLNIKANENRLTIAPHLPVNWDSLKADHIRIGERRLNFTFKRLGKNCVYTFDPGQGGDLFVDFLPSFPAATVFGKAYLNGNEIPFTTYRLGDQESAVFGFTVKENSILIIEVQYGIGILPVVTDPAPGDPADGLRVTSARFAGTSYTVDLEGPAGTTGDFKLRMLNGTRISKLVNSDIFALGADMYLLRVKFNGTDQKYVRKTVIMETVK